MKWILGCAALILLVPFSVIGAVRAEDETRTNESGKGGQAIDCNSGKKKEVGASGDEAIEESSSTSAPSPGAIGDPEILPAPAEQETTSAVENSEVDSIEGGHAEGRTTTQDLVKIGEDDNGGSVELKRGAYLELSYSENPTCGPAYCWSPPAHNECLVACGRKYVSDRPFNSAGPPLCGIGGKVTLRFLGKKTGTTALEMQQSKRQFRITVKIVE